MRTNVNKQYVREVVAKYIGPKKKSEGITGPDAVAKFAASLF